MEKPDLLNTVMDALLFAADRHKFDKTKNDEPYINHLLEVCHLICTVGKIDDPQILVAAALHDILDKTTTKTEELNVQFGEEAGAIVLELTEGHHLNGQDNYHHLAPGAKQLSVKGRIVKLADKIANVESIILNPPTGWDIKKRIIYLEATERIISTLKGTNEFLEEYFKEMLSHERKTIKYPLWA